MIHRFEQSNTELWVETNHEQREVRIWAEHTMDGRRHNLTWDGRDFVAEVVEGCGMGELKPLYKLPINLYKLMLAAFVQHNEREKIHTQKEDHLKGKFEATERHLMDSIVMRDALLDLLKQKRRQPQDGK